MFDIMKISLTQRFVRKIVSYITIAFKQRISPLFYPSSKELKQIALLTDYIFSVQN